MMRCWRLRAQAHPSSSDSRLGQAREVKVALSGLFGRFVARAYLERYFSLSLRSEPLTVVFVPSCPLLQDQPLHRDKIP